MRLVFAALALAGALAAAWPAAAAPVDDRYPMQAQAGTTAADVTRAKRCAPPFGCKRVKPRRPPVKPDWRVDIAATSAPPSGSEGPARIRQIVDAAAATAGVPVALARALVRVESGGNPHLRGRQGEWGLTQIKCATARGLGFAGSCAALADAAINLRWGLKHARLALARGSIGFHQAGLGARRVSAAYVGKINAAMGEVR